MRNILFKELNVKSTEEYFKIKEIDFSQFESQILIKIEELHEIKSNIRKQPNDVVNFEKNLQKVQKIENSLQDFLELIKDYQENILNDIQSFWNVEKTAFQQYDDELSLKISESFSLDFLGNNKNFDFIVDLDFFELKDWGTKIIRSLSDNKYNMEILSKSNLLERISNLEEINWNDFSELPEEIIQILINKQKLNILKKIVKNNQVEFSNHQVRDIIHIADDELMNFLILNCSYKDYLKSIFCKNEEDFKNHTIHHIENVKDISLDIIELVFSDRKYIDYFKINKYNKEELIRFIYHGISLHDKAKIEESNDFLERNNLSEPLYKTLYKFYGRGINDQLKEVVDNLNEIDNSIIDNYLEKFPQDLKIFFKIIEKLADCIERGSNEVTPEEMGTIPMSSSEFLKGKIPNLELEIVKIMEKKYKQTYYSG